jgi:hypothetical protein
VRLSRARAAALIVGVLLLAVGVAHAAPSARLTYTETDLGPGGFEYEYTFFNTSDPVLDAGVDLFEVDMAFAPGTLLVLSPPTTWDVIWSGGTTGPPEQDAFINSFSPIPGEPPFGTDVPPGESLGGLTFTLDYRLGDTPFTAYFTDPSGGDPLVFQGISEAAAAPLPATSLLLLAGVLAYRCAAVRRLVARSSRRRSLKRSTPQT